MSDPGIYTVGWICAITTEYVAAQAFLDEAHEGPEYVSPGDTNGYALGKIGKHNVVIAVLPKGEYGISAAAGVAKDMGHSFPNVRIGLMVGIGGGAPSPKHDIRLGDIVVSAPQAHHGGVFQYDFGKTIQDQIFQETGCLNQPPTVLLTAVSGIEAQYELNGHQLGEDVNNAIQKKPRLRKKYSRPDPSTDRLYESKFIHTPINAADCDKCRADPSGLVERPERDEDENDPVVHYGIIASGSQLMKDALIRDKFAAEKGILCFEMEAAGLMNRFPCLVIRGICDYSDSHKNKEWQGYAAMVAAAYAKDLLRQIVSNRVEMTKKISDILSDIEGGQKHIAETVRRVGQDINLAKLQLVEGAAYHSHNNEGESLCHSGTRASVLQHIYEWTEDKDGKCIYWLQGMAGTGKSTICRTVAYELDKRGVLGASFFFKRGEGDRGKAARFFPTIADQLAHRHPCLAPHVLKAIEADRSITEKALNMQFRELLLQPLRGIETNPEAPGLTVVVVDALDECDQERDAKTIIALLPQLKKLASSRVKIFVTSRPEFPIRLEFDRISGSYQDLVLHQVDERVILDDILSFLTAELGAIRDEYNSLRPKDRRLSLDWPDQMDVQRLAEIAVPLFIFAATARRFIGERKLGPPDKQLGKILEYKTEEMSKLDATYLPVLDQLVVGLNEIAKENVIREFQEVVGSIVVLATPLSTASLSSLLGIDREIIENKLDLLHSVLDVPSDSGAPVRLLHLSFRDFLVGDKTHQFWADERVIHERMSTSCLDLLMNSGCLKKDICDLQMPGTLQESVSWSTINRCLPSEVQYACLYWVYHLKDGNVQLDDEHQALQFLQRHFLHWFEALSLLGGTPEGILMIDQLQSLVNPSNGAETSRFLHDAKRFMLNCQSGVQQAPLQLYSSALLFAPGKSVIRKIFQEHTSWINTTSNAEDDWNACLQVLDCHARYVSSVVFSNHGGMIASGSGRGTLRVWDAATGAPQCVLQYAGKKRLGFSGNVTSLAFSSDDAQLASGLCGGQIDVWDVASGVLQYTLEGHPSEITTMAFLNNGPSRVSCLSSSALLASGSDDGTINVWDASTGALQHTHKNNLFGVWSVAFLRDTTQLLAVFKNGYIAFYDTARTMAKSAPTMTHGNRRVMLYITALATCEVTLAMLSKNGKQVATGFKDGTAMIFDTATGVHRCTLGKSPLRAKVSAIEFSSNGRKVAMLHDAQVEDATWDLDRITIWDAETGELQRILKASALTGTVPLAFSRCGRQLVVGNCDGKAKVWDVETGASRNTSETSGNVQGVMLSRNGAWLVTTSVFRTHSFWDWTTGTLQYILEQASGTSVLADSNVSFSSNRRQLASVSEEGSINICEAATGTLQHTLNLSGARARSVAFSSNGKLAAGFRDGTVRVWDAATWAPQHSFGGVCGERALSLGAVAFSDNGKLLGSRSDGRTIKIWDPATGNLERVIHNEELVSSLAFSESGRVIASFSGGRIHVWDVLTGTLLWRVSSEALRVLEGLPTLSFDATGSYLLSGAKEIPLRRTDSSETGIQVMAGWELDFYNQPQHGSQAESPSQGAGEQPFRGYSLGFDGAWIRWNGHNIIWIPPARRPRFSDLSPSYTTIAFCYESGEFAVLSFPANGPPGWK